jgi:lycopene cyclase domain-containing protein
VTYTALAASAVLVASALDLFVIRTRLLGSTAFWASYAIILGFQLVVNGILTGHHIVNYDPAAIIGMRIVHAPVEDLAFGFAMTLTTLMAWSAGVHQEELTTHMKVELKP